MTYEKRARQERMLPNILFLNSLAALGLVLSKVRADRDQILLLHSFLLLLF